MADPEPERPYKLVTSTGEERASSRNYTGSGVAEYPNGDKYEGEFDSGVLSRDAGEARAGAVHLRQRRHVPGRLRARQATRRGQVRVPEQRTLLR